MNNFSGEIFSGEIDQNNTSFYLTGVKSLNTGSVLSMNQLTQLSNYLNKQDDSCMLTINDQIPVLIQQQEIDGILKDIGQIVDTFKKGVNKMSKKSSEKANTVAQKTYQYSDYYSDDQLSKGMAVSHEQVSDTYMEGTIDRAVDHSNERDKRDDNSDEENIPRKI